MSKLNAFAQDEKGRMALLVQRELIDYQRAFLVGAHSASSAGV